MPASQGVPAVNVAEAPWCVLLGEARPLQAKHGWTPRDMLRLRSTCKALRAGVESVEFFRALLLRSSKAFARPDALELSGRHAFLLCQRVVLEINFLHQLHDVCRRESGQRPGDTPPCTVAGSYALHRMMIQDETAGGPLPDWSPGDLDIFVSGCREEWTDAEVEAWDAREADRVDGEEHAMAADLSYVTQARPIDERGKRRPLFERVVDLARDFLHQLYPNGSFDEHDREGYMHTDAGATVAYALPEDSTLGAYDRAELLSALDDDVRARWAPALEAQLPSRGGFLRPHRLGTIISLDLTNYGHDKAGAGPPLRATLADCMPGTLWRALRSVNIIEYATPAPLTSLEVTGSFDMLQCGVAIEPSGPSGVRFECSDET